MNVIIFSFNRYAQLELLLKSLDKYSDGGLNTTILYQEREDIIPVKKTQERIAKKFNKLKSFNSINSIASLNFKKDVMKLLGAKDEYTIFFNDSNIIYKHFKFEEIAIALSENKNVVSFSLRLGRNVNFCYNTQTDNNMYGIEDFGDNTLKWEWNKAYLDFGYPFSFDGHVFRSDEIKRLMRNARGKTPVELEDGLQIFDTYPKSEMMSFKESVLINRVDVLSGKGEMQELTIRYGGGGRAVLTNSYFTNVNAVSQEMELKFK